MVFRSGADALENNGFRVPIVGAEPSPITRFLPDRDLPIVSRLRHAGSRAHWRIDLGLFGRKFVAAVTNPDRIPRLRRSPERGFVFVAYQAGIVAAGYSPALPQHSVGRPGKSHSVGGHESAPPGRLVDVDVQAGSTGALLGVEESVWRLIRCRKGLLLGKG